MNFRNTILLLASIVIGSASAMFPALTPEERRNVLANRLLELTNLNYDRDEILAALPEEDRQMLTDHFARLQQARQYPQQAKDWLEIDKLLFKAAMENLITQPMAVQERIRQLGALQESIKTHKKAYAQMHPQQARKFRQLMHEIDRQKNQLRGVGPAAQPRRLQFQ